MRPPAFSYLDNQLHCEGVSVSDLVRKFGTPLYAYSATAVRERFCAFDRAFRSVPHTICYSVKANSNLTILRLLEKLGAGFDVVSGGELARLQRVSRPAIARTVFSGVGKTADEIDAALRSGILIFNVESEGELQLLAARAARLKKNASIALRVNPDVPAETHPYISTGLHEHKFGVPIADALRLYAIAGREKSLEIAGVSVHIGSQITDVRPFDLTIRRVAELVRELRAQGHRIRFVDAGGGLGVTYQTEPQQADDRARSRHARLGREFEQYASVILRPLEGLKLHLLLEPGRAIIAPAGALIARVLYIKQNGAKRFVVVDAAMNDLIRPSLYGAYHEIVPVIDGRQSPSAGPFDVVGPVCETGDFLARDRLLPPVAEGELLAVLDAGAYGMSLASNYNSRPRPPEVLIDGRSARVVRRRESVEDLMRGEK